MSRKKQVSVGDWVRFPRDGRLVIGVIEYLIQEPAGELVIITDVGQVGLRYVLETRRDCVEDTL